MELNPSEPRKTLRSQLYEENLTSAGEFVDNSSLLEVQRHVYGDLQETIAARHRLGVDFGEN